MKLGWDIRTTQLGSGNRGIGAYLCDLIEGVTQVAPTHEYVFIAMPNLPLPERLQNLLLDQELAYLPTQLINGYSWSQPIPKLWRLKYKAIQTQQRSDLTKLAATLKLDTLHIPTAIDGHFFSDCGPVCKVVKTFHDAIPLIHDEEYILRWPEAQRYVYQLQLRSYMQADTVVAISESARLDAIKLLGVNPDKIQTVYNSVPEVFATDIEQMRKVECLNRLGIDHPYFLFCSAFDYTKNIPRILEAFSKAMKNCHNPYQLVMVSQGRDEVRLKAFDCGLNNNEVIFTGYVSDSDLLSLYSGATALVSPSLYEGFGLPAAQAMKAGVPVIVSDRSSQPEVVGDAGICVDPYSTDAIAEAMVALANDQQLREELIKSGRTQVQKFDWLRQAKAMMDIYMHTEQKATEVSTESLTVGIEPAHVI